MRPDISIEKFKALCESINKCGEENKIEPMELLAGLLQLVQGLMGREKMIVTYDGQRIEIK